MAGMRGQVLGASARAAAGQAVLMLVALGRMPSALHVVARVAESPDRCREGVGHGSNDLLSVMPPPIEQQRDQFVGLAWLSKREVWGHRG